MSRNFELLTQIESEVGAKDHRTRAAADRAVVKAVVPSDAGDVGGEEMLRLVQRIFLSTNGSAPRQVVFCGVDGENGSSSICASAGRTLAANSSRSVCLVDANLRSPRLSGFFGVDTTIPVSSKSASVREQCVQIDGNLWLAGTDLLADDRGVLLSVDELRHLFAQLCEVFEYVLIDAPGTSVCGDAAILGQVADAAVLVIEANSTRRLSARNAKEVLDASGVRLLGTVLHNRSFPIPEGLYKRL
jgi:succinoglycan biosynthesis transport protein ExoP